MAENLDKFLGKLWAKTLSEPMYFVYSFSNVLEELCLLLLSSMTLERNFSGCVGIIEDDSSNSENTMSTSTEMKIRYYTEIFD